MRFLMLGLVVASPLAAQTTGGYIVRLGNDTVAVERFTRTANRIEGEILAKAPFVTVRTWSIDFGPDGRATRAEATTRRPGEANPFQSTVTTFTRDSAMSEIRRDTAVQRRRVAMPGQVFGLAAGPNNSWAITEVLSERFRAARLDSVAFPGYFLGGTAGTTISWVRMGRDSVRIYSGDAIWVGRLDRDGRLLAVSPRAGTQLFSAERIAAPDVPQLATAWRTREQQSAQMGLLSPRDTTRATVGGATLWVDYGRPSKRGRQIFGTPIAPWNQVWRTGANAATQFRTDRALSIGGVTLQPGLYTLWTIPSESGWKLLINSQTGQWGTAHDPARDLYQLDMRTESLANTVERFTISISTSGDSSGALHIDWDNTRASIPFTVR